MSDDAWVLVVKDKYAFTAIRAGEVFTLKDALCHRFFEPNEIVSVHKRDDPTRPGTLSSVAGEPWIVIAVNQWAGVLKMALYGK